ncbi:MAG: hypothetical protein VW397_08325 [Candidatus Margulisiibacteriota bacterium]
MERINTLKDSFVNLIPNKKGGMRKPVSTCMSTQPGTLTSTLASKENKGPVGRFFGYLDTLTNEEEKEALMDKFNTNLDRFGITINSGAFQVNGRGLADITKGAGKNTDDRLRFIVALVALDLIPHSVYMNPSIISEGISEEEKARLESKAQIQKKAGMIELINKLCISCHGMLRHFKMPNQGNLSQTFGGYVVEGGFGFRKPKDSTKTDHHLTSKGFTVYKQTSPSCSIFGKSKPHNAFQQRFTHSQTNRDPLTYITEKNGAYRTAINNEEGSVQFSSDNIDQIFHGISDLKNNNAKEFIATVLFGEREASVGADGSVIVAEDALRQWGGGIIDLSRPTIMVKSDTDFIGMLKDEFFKLNLDEQLNKFGFDEAKIYEINAELSTPMKILKIYNTLYGITGTTISIQEPQSQFKKNWGDGGVELENVFSFFPGLTVPSAAAASGLEGINYDTNLFLMTEAQQKNKINALYHKNKGNFESEENEVIDNLKDQLEDESLDKTARTVIIQAILEAKKDLLIKKGILVEDADNVNALRQALKLDEKASLDDIRGYLELDADAEITKVTVDEKIAELKKAEEAAKALAIAEAEKEAASGLEGINYDTNLFLMTEAQQKNKINALYHKNKGNFESEENEVIDNLKDQLEDESLDKTARTVIIQAILEAKKDLLIKKGILVEDADNVNALRQALKLDEKASLDDIRGYLELDADAEITKVTVDEKIAELKKAEEAATAVGTGAEVVNDGGELPTAFPQRSSLSESEHALQLRSYMQAHLSIFREIVVDVEEAFWKDVATVADYSYVTLLTELGLYDSSEPAPDMRRLLFQMIQSLHLKCDTDEIHPIDRHIISNTDSLLAFGIITQKPEGVPYEYQPEHGPLEEIQHFVAENFIYEEESIRTNLQTLLTNIKTAHGQLEKKLTTAMNENPTQPFPSDIILENENDIQAIYEQIQSLLAANEEYLDIERLLNLMNALKESGAINNPGVEITLSHPSRRDSLTIIKQHNAQATFIERLTPNKEKASETRSDEDSFEGSPSLVATTVSKTPHVHGVVVAETVHNAPLKIGQNAAGGGTPRQTPVRGQNAAGGGTPVGRVSNSAGGASVSVTPPTSLTVEHSTGTFNNSPPLPEEKKK